CLMGSDKIEAGGGHGQCEAYRPGNPESRGHRRGRGAPMGSPRTRSEIIRPRARRRIPRLGRVVYGWLVGLRPAGRTHYAHTVERSSAEGAALSQGHSALAKIRVPERTEEKSGLQYRGATLRPGKRPLRPHARQGHELQLRLLEAGEEYR